MSTFLDRMKELRTEDWRSPALQLAAEADARIAALQEENAELRKDAERYRWLKENAEVSFREHQWFNTGSGQRIHSIYPISTELDAAIDEAIATGAAK